MLDPEDYSRMLIINGTLSTWSGAGDTALHKDSGQAEFLSPYYAITSNIFVQNITGVYLDENASAGTLAAGSDIYIFYSSAEPLSPDGIGISLEPAGIITHNSTVEYSVHSNLTYSLNATLGGTELIASNGSITIDASLFPMADIGATASTKTNARAASEMAVLFFMKFNLKLI